MVEVGDNVVLDDGVGAELLGEGSGVSVVGDIVVFGNKHGDWDIEVLDGIQVDNWRGG